ncbi:MAG: gamma-glutamylcyclotransferase [Bacteroidales bacterium]|nr:gamma-glutamylcyclotransferase [Bacteroidales bacterium]
MSRIVAICPDCGKDDDWLEMLEDGAFNCRCGKQVSPDSTDFAMVATKKAPEGMLYFAYGSNLSLDQMEQRLPNARPLCKATLRFWRLTYKANFKGNGVATIEKNSERRGAVYGALYVLSAGDLATMDRYEGTPRVYQRRLVTVESKFGRVKAITYVMNDYFKPHSPNPTYVGKIQQGFWDWGLPIGKLAVTP